MSIANPIIQRELLGVLRTGRSLAIQIVMVLVLTAVVLLLWPADSVVDLDTNRDGHQSQQLFRTFTYGLLVCMLMLAPVFPATTIVRERDARTLQLLLTSRLTPLSIVFGKITAAVGFILLLLVLSMPAAAACFTMGGIAFMDVVVGYLVLAVCAVQYALVGLLISSFARSSDSALRMTYGAVLALSVLTILPQQLLSSRIMGPIADVLMWLEAISPIPAIMTVLGLEHVGDTIMADTGWRWAPVARYVVIALGCIIGCTVWLTFRLTPKLLDRSRAAGKITDDRSSKAQWFRRIMFLGAFDPQRREQFIGLRLKPILFGGIGSVVFGVISVGVFWYGNEQGWLEGTMIEKLLVALLGCGPAMVSVMFAFSFMMNLMLANPVVVKEFRSRAMGRSHWMMRLIAACLIISLSLTFVVATLSQQTSSMAFLGGVLVIFQMGLVLLIGPALSTALISAEVESGGWELMQMTMLRPSQIVLGKLVSVTWTLVLLLLATVPGYAAMLIIDSGYQDRVLQVLACLALTALFAVLLSAVCSSLLKRTTAATSAAYIVIVLLCVGTLVPWLGEGILFGHDLVEAVLRFNPVATALSVIDMPGLSKDEYHLASFNWRFLGIASGVCMLVLWLRTWQLTRPR